MKISLLITFAHVLLIVSCLFFQVPFKKTKPLRAVKIRTIVLQEERAVPPPLQPVVKLKAEKPVVNLVKPVVKLKAEKPVVNVVKPVVKPKPPSPAPPKKDIKHEKLTRLLQESLASCDKGEIIKPKQIGSLSCETLLYQESLIAFLESHLTLPEKGEVGLSLTLNRAGVVQKIALHGKTSEKNRLFVETVLPTLCFPPFGNDFKGEKSHTFSITLTSS